ncbi:MAG TPA: hypothetical protein VGK30_18330 [Candidatus Binatia bacterium]|jgi:hypothetical protein
MAADVRRFAYTFRLPDGTERRFDVSLDAESLMAVPAPDAPKPAWTKLSYCQCVNCPLGSEVEHCPVAVNLAGVVETFKDAVSFEHTVVTVETSERVYEKTTTLQKGLSSIIGIYMVTSNCPVMDRLRPMVRFHLPFASVDETIYRAVAMYLVAQYFRMRKGRTPDWKLEHLADVYADVAQVNAGMMERLRHASTEDANVNALTILSAQGGMVPMYLEESLAKMEHLFRDLIERDPEQ